MSNSPIITVKNIGKKYNINHQQSGYIALRDVITNAVKSPLKFLKSKVRQVTGLETKEEFWALKDINFEIMKGEVVGIIGRNGAGKSTLLKILSQITPPTTGEIRINGTVGSLLEVGTGFHPELTGRENIFLNGAILGMKKKDIVRKFDEIVKFADIEKFLDTPVKYYSSGMYVRLAFSVAAHMETDILIIDEVLAVGDAEFQKKCLGKMNEITKEEGRTILFVSHNIDVVKKICSKCILLENGTIKTIGETNKIIDEYLFQDKSNTNIKRENKNKDIFIESVDILDNKKNKKSIFHSNEEAFFSIKINNIKDIKNFSIVWFLYNSKNEQVAVSSSGVMAGVYYSSNNVNFSINLRSLLADKYSIRIIIHKPGFDNYDEWEDITFFDVDFNNSPKNNYYPGIWEVKQYVENTWYN
jgi:lipopolysaccharide transport system ATP-binding protein